MSKKIISKNLQTTKKLACEVAEVLKKCQRQEVFLLLTGDLGAGKTTFTKQIIKAMNINDNVTSPTFTILNQYQAGELIINHMDAYRLSKANDLEMFIEQFENNINIIEWWTNLHYDFSTKKCFKVEIKFIDDTTRQFIIEGW